MIGGIICIFGILKEKKSLIYVGIMLVGIPLFLTHLDRIITFESITYFTGLFLIFYWSAIYIDELVGREVLLKEKDMKDDPRWKRYKRMWIYSAAKYFSLTFIISFLISMVVWNASIDFRMYGGDIISFLGALGFGLSAFFLLYILLIKLPERYDLD